MVYNNFISISTNVVNTKRVGSVNAEAASNRDNENITHFFSFSFTHWVKIAQQNRVKKPQIP